MKCKILNQRFTVNDVHGIVICGNWPRRKIRKWFNGRKYATFADLIDADLAMQNYNHVARRLNFTNWQKRWEYGLEGRDASRSVSEMYFLSLFDCIVAYGLDNGFLEEVTP